VRSSAILPDPQLNFLPGGLTHCSSQLSNIRLNHGYAEAVTTAIQGSLFDVGQEFGLGGLGLSVRRTALADGAWLDVAPGWLRGADALFERLLRNVPWRAERRRMYDQVVDVPRLLCHFGQGQALPDSALEEARSALDGYYERDLGESLSTAGLCLYRDGRDSVAWHGDNSGRQVSETVVAIVSLGNPRHLLLRRRRGSDRALRFLLGNGDLLVMGGTCQRTWEHAVPKTAMAVGPRISVQFRPAGIR
jgi:alkylated DNA repair dioxygenase AlkB